MSPASVSAPEPFDPLGALPSGTTVLEASAGTGKTWAVGALVTRYVAEGHARLEELLVITFGRAASQELRERVREQLVRAEEGLRPDADAGSGTGPGDPLLALLRDAAPGEVALRHARVRQALADFDGATIATTHQFCQQVLRSLGVAGDTDTGAELVDDLDDLVVEVVDDLFLARFGGTPSPPFTRTVALQVAREAVGDPQAVLVAAGAQPGNVPDHRLRFAEAVRAEVERRKRHRGLLSYDDLLSRLRDALAGDDAPAAERMRQRWRIVLVDEFQDTDPVQWEVLDLAFSGVATMVLIGDPKQAIYAFRGGDVAAYLRASGSAGDHRTLATNWRSDQALVDALQVVLGRAELGDPRITVLPVQAAHRGTRLAGAPEPAPLRLRLVEGDDQLPVDVARERIATDLAAEVARLLHAGATFDGRPLLPTDVAVLLPGAADFPRVQTALGALGVASVVAGGSSNVMTTEAGAQWLALLEALEQPHRAPRVRAVALTAFVGCTAAELDAGGDRLTDEVGERVRRWLDLARSRGIAAVHEAVVAEGLGRRVLSQPDGERLLTDLHHVGQVLHDQAHHQHLGVPGLLEWLRQERTRTRSERSRRLDTDAQAVQLTTMHSSKGLQFPVVMLPLAFNRWRPRDPELLFHDDDGRRCRDVGGLKDGRSVEAAVAETAGEELRLTYVALTRAQSQVVAWWAPTRDSVHGGLSRLLLGRGPGDATTPRSLSEVPTPGSARARLQPWVDAGGLAVESADPVGVQPLPRTTAARDLGVRSLERDLDTAWRRTSYSGLVRAEEQAGRTALPSEPEVAGTVDEDPAPEEPPVVLAVRDRDAELASPMDALPSGATLGSLVHGVLEHADPEAPDLLAELRARVEEQRRWWSVPTPSDELATALLPSQHTPLGPLADHRTLAQVPLRDRLRELDFEVPLAGGERPTGQVLLRQVAGLLREHLADDDPVRPYAERLETPVLGEQLLRGYLSGSVDVVLRVGTPTVPRFVVVDYKTNRLGSVGEPLTSTDYDAPALAEAMLHSHYPLQALLYSAVLHRYLRWRLADYDPEAHLGGVLYLYLRGMCGPDTPTDDGVPHGVFSWRPPAALVVGLSDLLAGATP